MQTANWHQYTSQNDAPLDNLVPRVLSLKIGEGRKNPGNEVTLWTVDNSFQMSEADNCRYKIVSEWSNEIPLISPRCNTSILVHPPSYEDNESDFKECPKR